MFSELKLSESVLKALEIKGFVIPTDIQTQCIPLIVDGKDVVGRSKTGSGKTFAFGLPAIDKVDVTVSGIEVIAICPTRELATQVTDEIRKISEFIQGCKIVPVYGGADITRQITSLKRAKIVVGTPGRIMDHIRRRTLKLDKIKMVVLDEADEMLNMGFREDIEEILKHVPTVRQTVMFSATMPPAIKAITKEYMTSPEYIELGILNSTIEEISQSFVRVNRTGKKAALVELFNKLKPERAVIFCNTKRMVDEINDILNKAGIKALALHGDMRQSERRRVMDDIKSHRVSTLVATDVAARGIDIDDVEYIFNFDLPNDVEYYIHRIGRTGRAGKSGKAISLINTKEQLTQINEFKRITNSDIKEHTISSELDTFEELKAGATMGDSRRGRSSRSSNRFSSGSSEEGTERRPYSRSGSSEGRTASAPRTSTRSAGDNNFSENTVERKPYVRKPAEVSGIRYGVDGKPTDKYDVKPIRGNSEESSRNYKSTTSNEIGNTLESSERKPYTRSGSSEGGRSYSGRTTSTRSYGSTEGSGERKPYARSGSSEGGRSYSARPASTRSYGEKSTTEGTGERKPYVRREGSEGGRSYSSRPASTRSYGNNSTEGTGRKPYARSGSSEGGRSYSSRPASTRSYGNNSNEGTSEKKPYVRREDSEGGRSYSSRPASTRSYGENSTEGTSERKPYARSGSSEGGRSYSARPASTRSYGNNSTEGTRERKPYARSGSSEGGRSYSSRPASAGSGEKKPYNNGERRTYKSNRPSGTDSGDVVIKRKPKVVSDNPKDIE